MKNYFIIIFCVITNLSLGSCGQKGPLTLPKKQFIIEQKDESSKPNDLEKDSR